MINNEEAVIKLPRTKSLEKFIDEVHTNLISLHLHRPPLLYAVDAIKTREKALEKTEREKSLKKNGKRLILEFGVGAGGTMRRLIEQFPCCSDNQNVLLYGFDSFEGLPEVSFYIVLLLVFSVRFVRMLIITLDETERTRLAV
jgi:hypothetical protein